MRIEDRDIPENAVAVFHPDKRVADSLGLVDEDRVRCRVRPGAKVADKHRFRRPPEFEFMLIGGSVGWFAPQPEIDYPGVPGFLNMFFLAGLIELAPPAGREWSALRLTQAGEFLFAVWRRDRTRRQEAYYAEQDRFLDSTLNPEHF